MESGPAGKVSRVCPQQGGMGTRTWCSLGRQWVSHAAQHCGPGKGALRASLLLGAVLLPAPGTKFSYSWSPLPSPVSYGARMASPQRSVLPHHRDSLLCLHHTATAQASRHGPRTAEGCPSDSLPAGQQVTGTVGTAPGSVPPQAHSHCPCRAPRALAQRSAKHVRRELHRSDGRHSPLAPFEAMGRSSSNCSESQTWLLSMGPTGMVLA